MPTPGMVLADKYRLEAEIGRGGTGPVWRAKRLELDADVAVKVLHVEGSQRADLWGWFSRAAKATLPVPATASSDLSAGPPVPSVQGAASPAVGPVSEAASPAVRPAARGREPGVASAPNPLDAYDRP